MTDTTKSSICEMWLFFKFMSVVSVFLSCQVNVKLESETASFQTKLPKDVW